MGWYYYLDDKIRFPLKGTCVAPKVVSPLRKGETVEVLRMAPEDACAGDMLVLIRWQGRTMAVPLSQLAAAIPTKPRPKPSPTGIIGWQWATVSDFYARQTKTHNSIARRMVSILCVLQRRRTRC